MPHMRRLWRDDIDACAGKNHAEVKPRDGLDSIKP
jgi:hypothetical protein